MLENIEVFFEVLLGGAYYNCNIDNYWNKIYSINIFRI